MAKKNFIFDKPDDSTGFLLWKVTNLWQREIKKALEKYDLTHSQFVLLASIHRLSLDKQEVSQILLSNYTKIDPMTTSAVLRALQSKGYIKRQEHKSDSRAKTVSLTDKGVKNIKPAIKTVEKFDKKFFTTLASDVEDFNSKLRKLGKDDDI